MCSDRLSTAEVPTGVRHRSEHFSRLLLWPNPYVCIPLGTGGHFPCLIPSSNCSKQRTQIIRQISELGDLRPGSITSTSGRCGKPSCRCHRPGQPGHGPHPRLTYKLDRKTVPSRCRLPPQWAKPSAKWESFASSSNCAASSWRSIPASANSGRRSGKRRLPRKKNGRRDPAGSRARARLAVARPIQRAAQDGPLGFWRPSR